jgi:uncharacterized membrane protein YidH (DUF202 family)
MLKVIGVVLIVLGIAGLAYGRFSWTQRETVIDAGPVEVTRDKTESVAFPPIAGGLLLVVGVVLLIKRA